MVVTELRVERLDAYVSEDIKSELISCLDEGYEKIVIDLGHVEFIDSSGIGMLVTILKKMGGSKSTLLCNMQKVVRSMFSLPHIDRVFTIYENCEEAIDSVAASPEKVS